MSLSYYWRHLAALKARSIAERLDESVREGQELVAIYQAGIHDGEGGISEEDVVAARSALADIQKAYTEYLGRSGL